MVQKESQQSSSPSPSLADDESISISSDDEFWNEVGQLADKLERKRSRESDDVPKSADRRPLKRLRTHNRDSTSSGNDSSRPESYDSRNSDNKRSAPASERLRWSASGHPFSENESSDQELEVNIPEALGKHGTTVRLGSPPARPTAWWKRLDLKTLSIVEDRLGPDFNFELDDPLMAWKNIPSQQYWGLPTILIQWDKHTLVSKDRFVELVKAKAKTDEIDPEYIDFLIAKRNVLISARGGYWSPGTMKGNGPQLFKIRMQEEGLRGPIGLERSRYKLPELIAQADEHTFVSGDTLKRKLDLAGVKIGQLLYEDQIFLMNRNASGLLTGNFSVLSIYAKGYRELSKTQNGQLKLPDNVQSKTAQDSTNTPYRDFTDDLYPREGECLYPKGPEDFVRISASGFRGLKEAGAGWAGEAAAMEISELSDARHDFLTRKPNAASAVRD